MFTPQNEQGVIYCFAILAEQAGWRLLEIGSSFPDALYEYKGEQWRVEFEFVASSFVQHKHDHRRCDLIVCWSNDYQDCSLPIIALSSNDWMAVQFQKADPKDAEIEYWKCRARQAENQLKRFRVHQETIPQIENDERKTRAREMIAKGMSHKAIAQELQIHRNTIANWLKHTNGTKEPTS